MRAPEAMVDNPKAPATPEHPSRHPSNGLRAAPAVLRTGMLLMSLALAACQTDGAGMSANGALAFDSIDGPPKATFDKLVGHLSDEAQSRQVKVASREDQGAYRVKGYLSMHVERGKASCAYAWDVYDPGKSRVVRITGEEKGASTKGSANWSACDDAVLARIADRSMADFAQALGVGGSTAPAAQPAPVETAATAAPAATGADEAPAAPAATATGPVADATAALAPSSPAALAYAAQ